MSYSKEKLRKIFFENSPRCNCDSQDCESNHRLCYMCREKIQWGEYNKENSSCSWNVDHIEPRSNNNNNNITNLKATHPWCNEEKGDRIIRL